MENFSFHIKSARIKLVSVLMILTVLTNAQSALRTALPQYLYPEFSPAVVKMLNGKSLTSEMNLNMVTGNMVFEKEGRFLDLVNIESVDTVYLQNSRFICFGKIFYEIIYAAPIALLLQHEGKIVPAGKKGAYGTTSQTSSITTISSVSSEFGYYNLELPPSLTVRTDKIYWVKKENNIFSFRNLKQFLKIFPDKEAELKEFIKNNRIRIGRRNDIVKLMIYCNDIINID